MTTLVTLENIKIKFQQLCWLIEHTHTTKQLNLLKEVCSEFEFKDNKTIIEEDEEEEDVEEEEEDEDEDIVANKYKLNKYTSQLNQIEYIRDNFKGKEKSNMYKKFREEHKLYGYLEDIKNTLKSKIKRTTKRLKELQNN